MQSAKSVSRLRRRIIVAAVILAAATLLCVYYYTAEPGTDVMPRCTFKVLTGWDCPGCGSQRAFHAMLHGHVFEAFGYNPAIFVMIPLAVLYAFAEWAGVPGLRRVLLSKYALWVLGAAIIVWTVLRNLLNL